MEGGSRALRLAVAAVALLAANAASAQLGDGPLPSWYLGPMVGYSLPDSSREADNGIGFQLVAGKVLAEALSIELHGFGTKFDSEIDGGPETELTGVGVDLALGIPDFGNPVFLLGGGSVQHKIGGVSESETYGDLGLGLYLPFTFGGELWRLEGRYRAIFAEHPALPDADIVEDLGVNLGFLLAFGRQEPPPPEPPLADADNDGVADAADICPGTPSWVRPDARGCAPDSDGDGVDEAHDDCPGTPAGTSVDDTGCEPRLAPPPVAMEEPKPVDEDGDGVADAGDACPHTVPRFNVDTKGCLIPEDVTLHNVHFDSSSSRLTGDGYVLLRSLAASLQAQPELTLEVSGHADASGGKDMNQALSQERAEVVRDFLTYLGIAEGRLTVAAHGETRPLKDNKTKESRAYNRRVQFRRTNK